MHVQDSYDFKTAPIERESRLESEKVAIVMYVI